MGAANEVPALAVLRMTAIEMGNRQPLNQLTAVEQRRSRGDVKHRHDMPPFRFPPSPIFSDSFLVNVIKLPRKFVAPSNQLGI
jgi:hypothetical protein